MKAKGVGGAIAAVAAIIIGLTAMSGSVSAKGCVDAGAVPPATGYGTFRFCGGTFQQLLDTSECPQETAVFFYNKPDGTFAAWVPGSEVGAVNAELAGLFPGAVLSGEVEDIFTNTIPAATIFIARCR